MKTTIMDKFWLKVYELAEKRLPIKPKNQDIEMREEIVSLIENRFIKLNNELDEKLIRVVEIQLESAQMFEQRMDDIQITLDALFTDSLVDEMLKEEEE